MINFMSYSLKSRILSSFSKFSLIPKQFLLSSAENQSDTLSTLYLASALIL